MSPTQLQAHQKAMHKKKQSIYDEYNQYETGRHPTHNSMHVYTQSRSYIDLLNGQDLEIGKQGERENSKELEGGVIDEPEMLYMEMIELTD